MSRLPGLGLALSSSGVMKIVLALGLGAAGGAVFFHWQMPLAWMMGAMAVTTVAALAGAPLQAPVRLRALMVAVIGVMLGSAFTPGTVERAASWLASLTGVLVYAVAVGGAVYLYLRRKPQYGPVSAYFSATPGGLTEMTLVGGAMGGDVRIIALTQSMRILVLVMIIPFWFRLFHGYVPSGTAILGSAADVSLSDAAILTVCAIAGFIAAKRLGVPAPALSGPMILSALVHLSGLTAAKPPAELVAIAQVIIGTAVGCRFTGIAVRRVFGTMRTGAGTSLAMLAAAAIFAFVLETATGLPFAALLLALAPGGLAEMSLICLSLGIDIAFVSTHHLVRIVFIVVLAPMIFRLFRERLGAEGGTRTPGE